jgi:hypothetical protein
MQKAYRVAAAIPVLTAVYEENKPSIHRAPATKLPVLVSYDRLRTQ